MEVILINQVLFVLINDIGSIARVPHFAYTLYASLFFSGGSLKPVYRSWTYILEKICQRLISGTAQLRLTKVDIQVYIV